MDSWNLVSMGARFSLVFLEFECRHCLKMTRGFEGSFVLELLGVHGLVLASGFVRNVLGVIADEDPREIDMVELQCSHLRRVSSNSYVFI